MISHYTLYYIILLFASYHFVIYAVFMFWFDFAFIWFVNLCQADSLSPGTLKARQRSSLPPSHHRPDVWAPPGMSATKSPPLGRRADAWSNWRVPGMVNSSLRWWKNIFNKRLNKYGNLNDIIPIFADSPVYLAVLLPTATSQPHVWWCFMALNPGGSWRNVALALPSNSCSGTKACIGKQTDLYLGTPKTIISIAKHPRNYPKLWD